MAKSGGRARNTMLVMTLVFWFSQSSYNSYVGPSLSGLGAAASLTGLVSGLYGFSQLLCRMPMGILSDQRRMHKQIIGFGALMSAVSGMGLYFFHTPAGFLLFRALAGVSSATWVCFTILYGSYFKPEEQASAVSLLTSVNYVGALSGMLCAGLVAELLGSRAVFLMAGLMGALAFVVSFFLVRSAVEPKPFRLREMLDTYRNGHLAKCAFLSMLVHVILWSTVQSYTPVIAKESFGAEGFSIGLMSVFVSVSMILSSVWAGKALIKRVGVAFVLKIGFSLYVVYCVLVPLAPSLPVLYALQFVGGFGNGFLVPPLNGWCTAEIAAEKKTTAMGFYQAVYGLGMTVGPITFGAIVQRAGFLPAYLFTTAVAAGAGIFVFAAMPGRKQPQPGLPDQTHMPH